MKKTLNVLSIIVERYYPDAFVFAILMSNQRNAKLLHQTLGECNSYSKVRPQNSPDDFVRCMEDCTNLLHRLALRVQQRAALLRARAVRDAVVRVGVVQLRPATIARYPGKVLA